MLSCSLRYSAVITITIAQQRNKPVSEVYVALYVTKKHSLETNDATAQELIDCI